jgi:hypothetical protein
VIYTTDSEHKLENRAEAEAFANFFRNADVVVFDAMYALAEAISVKADWGHSSNIVGVELCQMARAKHLVLFHHEPANNDATLEGLLKEARRFEELTRGDHRPQVSAHTTDWRSISEAPGRPSGSRPGAPRRGRLFLLAFAPYASPLRTSSSTATSASSRSSAPRTPVTVVLHRRARARDLRASGPWPRTRMAELNMRISDHKPASIGLDFEFPEPTASRRANREELSILPSAPRADAALAALQRPAARRHHPRAQRGARHRRGTSDPRYSAPPRAAPVVTRATQPAARQFPGHLGNVPSSTTRPPARPHELRQQDQVVRVIPLISRVQDQLVPALSVETLRVALDSGIRIDDGDLGLLKLRMDEVATSMHEDGTAYIRMSHFDPRADFRVRGDVGKIDPERIKGKVVLVGMSGIGVLDFKTTPLGEFVPGVMLHAQMIENMYNGVSLVRPAVMVWLEAAALVACGSSSSGSSRGCPRCRASTSRSRWCWRSSRSASSPSALHLLFDFAWPVIGTMAVFGTTVVGTLSEAERQRRQLREQAARMAGEVDAARRIQMGLLPDRAGTVGNDRRYSLAALLEPARTVGGDFYDCFMIDDKRWCSSWRTWPAKGLPRRSSWRR